MKSFYCAKVPRRVTDEECCSLEPCPTDRNKCEIYQKYVKIWDQKLSEAPGPDVPAEKKPVGKPAKKTAKTRVERKEKTCRQCGKTKPITEFYKKSESADGHACSCKECKRKYQQQVKQKQKQKKQAQKSEEQPAQAPAPDNQDCFNKEKSFESPRRMKEDSSPSSCQGILDNCPNRLVVDFSPYPDLYKRLVRAAADDFRPLDMEVLALVRHVLSRIDEKQLFYQEFWRS